MSTTGPIVPPYPTSDPSPSGDQPVASTYSPESEMDDRLAWAVKNKETIAQLLSDLDDQSKSLSKVAAMSANAIGWVIAQIDKFMLQYEGTWYAAKLDVFKQILPDSEIYHGDVFAQGFAAFQDVLGGLMPGAGSWSGSPLGEVAAVIEQAIVQPFALIGTAQDPDVPGSGIANMQYLLEQALGLAVAQWFIDSAANETGMGILKTLAPIMYVMNNAVNPYNAVRMAMDASYTAMIRAPLTRDINRAYPIKDLGLSALAKLYLRGEIDETTYLSRTLDSGLDNTQAQQLVIESRSLLTESHVVKLHQMGIVSDDDVLQYLAQKGYAPGDAAAELYLINHDRYFSIQERIGNEAVTAWKSGYIDQPTLESILQQMGFTADEIQLLEIEGQFVKNSAAPKTLSYSQVKDLYTASIVGIDYVIAYLTNEGYSATDVNNLVLLDFTTAAEKEVRTSELLARLRVQEEQAKVLAAEEQIKNETDLANARLALAKVLSDAQATLGQLESLPGIAALLG